MTSLINLAGRVAIVTGAGGGLGRQYALDLAARGVKVVVNDLGTSLEGIGQDSAPANAVVEEIRAAGGTAIANGADVSSEDEVKQMVAATVAAFGTVDILVANAGITIRKPIQELSLKEFRAVLDVHVIGAFNCCKAVWSIMQAQGRGRIVLFTSAGGLYGIVDRSNYAAAKGAIIAMTRALAEEGKQCGIRVNTVAPMAETRMSAVSLRPGFAERMTLDWPSALVSYFSSDDVAANGEIVAAGMGYFARTATVEAEGFVTGCGDATPELVAAHWDEIVARDPHYEYASVGDYMQKVIPSILTRVDRARGQQKGTHA